MRRARSTAALLAWLALLGVGLTIFHGVGDATLPAPPARPGAWPDWLGATDPAVATMALLRLVVLALSWYLVGVTGIGAVARLAGAVRLVRVADALTVPAVRRLLRSALGVGLATAMVAAATPAARAQPLPLQLLEQAAGESEAPATVDEPLPAHGPAVPLTAVTESADDEPVGRPGTRHTVVVGESFWRIAADRMAAAARRTPSDEEVAVYWRRLIEHNRSRLVDPDNPDLLLPGQRLDLPPLAG